MPRGLVTLVKEHYRKRDISLFLGENVITDQMLARLIALLATGDEDNRAVKMQFGTGSVSEIAGDTSLQSPITPVKEFTDYSFPTDRSVMMEASLTNDEGNGFYISEVGILTSEDVLCARKTFDAQLKTTDYVFHFRWTIEF